MLRIPKCPRTRVNLLSVCHDIALVPVISFINSRPSGLFCSGQRYLARYTHRCNNGMNVVGVTSCFLVGLSAQCIGRNEYLALENQSVASVLKCTEQKKMGSCHLSLKFYPPFLVFLQLKL